MVLDMLFGQLSEVCWVYVVECCCWLVLVLLCLLLWQGWCYVIGCVNDILQVWLEFGYVINVVVLIGWCEMSCGFFFDCCVFLIFYDLISDVDGEIVEGILFVVGLVGVGIVFEYYFFIVDNECFGCGLKIIYNIIGLFGVMEGVDFDLCIGLFWQMVEIYELMCLLVVVEQMFEWLMVIFKCQLLLQELIDNVWIILVVKDLFIVVFYIYCLRCGWLLWFGKIVLLQVVCLVDWFVGEIGVLVLVLLFGVVL